MNKGHAEPATPALSSSGNASQYLRQDTAVVETPADDKELLCICFRPEDGRPMIECDNRGDCFLRWYHIECIGLNEDELPGEDGTFPYWSQLQS